MTTVFAASPALIALNNRDPHERLERCMSLADLIENFEVEAVYDDDAFLGIVDVLPPLLADTALA